MSNHSVLCFCWIDCWTSAPGSFLFYLRNNDDLGPFNALLKNENDWLAICRDNSYVPCFFDLCITDNAGLTSDSWTDLDRKYQAPSGYTAWEPNTTSLLAGSEYFTPSEIEVLYLN